MVDTSKLKEQNIAKSLEMVVNKRKKEPWVSRNIRLGLISSYNLFVAIFLIDK